MSETWRSEGRFCPGGRMHSIVVGLAFLAMVMAPCVVALTVNIEEEDANFPGEAPQQ